MLTLTNNYLYTLKTKNCLLSKNINLSVLKRHFPGPGHINKILHSLAKNNKKASILEQVQNAGLHAGKHTPRSTFASVNNTPVNTKSMPTNSESTKEQFKKPLPLTSDKRLQETGLPGNTEFVQQALLNEPYDPKVTQRIKNFASEYNMDHKKSQDDSVTFLEGSPLIPKILDETLKSTLMRPTAEELQEKLIEFSLNKRNNNNIETLEDHLQTKTTQQIIFAQEEKKLREQEKELLKEYESINQNNKWNEAKRGFLKKLELFEDKCSNIYLSDTLEHTRDILELQRLFPEESFEKKTPVEQLTFDFLGEETIRICYTQDDYQKELLRMQKGYDLLFFHGKNLPESFFLEVIRRLGLIINNDAIYKDDFEQTRIQKESEGYSIHNSVYKFIAKAIDNLPFIIQDSPLNSTQISFIYTQLQNDVVYLYKYKYNIDFLDPNKEKLIESSDEIHYNYATFYLTDNGNKIYLSLGQFTSTNDANTVVLCDKQYLNKDDFERNKEQRFRPYNQWVKMPFSDVIEDTEGTNFIKATNYNGYNIKQTIINAILTHKNNIEKNTIRSFYNFNRENLQKIAEKYALDKIDQLQDNKKKLENKFKGFSTEKKFEKEEEHMRQFKNQLKAKLRAEVVKKLSLEYKEMKKDIQKQNTESNNIKPKS